MAVAEETIFTTDGLDVRPLRCPLEGGLTSVSIKPNKTYGGEGEIFLAISNIPDLRKALKLAEKLAKGEKEQWI